jgi:predicted 3-demethylubiquinone-9 3-methyltransferase (glyoxalase superfamily)
VIDAGASFSLTPHKSDFVGLMEKPDIEKLYSLSATAKVEGMGWVNGKYETTWDKLLYFELKQTMCQKRIYGSQAHNTTSKYINVVKASSIDHT